MNVFIDTNLFLRYFEQLDSAVDFMEKLKVNSKKYFVPSVVVNEVGWTLSRFYKLGKVEVIKHIERMLNVDKFVVVYDYDVKAAVEQYKTSSVKLNDCYIWSYMKSGDQIVSYDQDFDKLPGIKRIEPKALFQK